MRYMHLTTKRIEGIVNPYDVLPQNTQGNNKTTSKK
jgi:hypothetical protein